MAIDTEFEALSRTLMALRGREGMSQTEVARKVGIAQTVYSRIERRPQTTCVGTLRRIAEALNEPLWKIIRHVEKAKHT